MDSAVEWIQRARQEAWALGQFNISSLEVLQGIVDAANEAHSPVLIGVSMGSLRHLGWPYLVGLVQGAKAAASVPLYFHLDHGDSYETVTKVIAAGFESVMIDASRLRYAENVDLVQRVVAYGHAHGVGVEAQIGETWDEEIGDMVESRTNPAEIGAYVAATGVDYLAISFGNTPGRQVGQADVDMELIRACSAASPAPIVLHGGTSIPADAVRQAIALGAAKINIDTAIRQAISRTLVSTYGSPELISDPRKPFRQVREAVHATVLDKMQLFGSINRAN